MYKSMDMDVNGIYSPLSLSDDPAVIGRWSIISEVPRANYKDLADVKLPQARPQMTESKLYPVEIVEGRRIE